MVLLEGIGKVAHVRSCVLAFRVLAFRVLAFRVTSPYIADAPPQADDRRWVPPAPRTHFLICYIKTDINRTLTSSCIQAPALSDLIM